ncbi:isoprenylcysteine carboxylmethyltransferase family protein [Pseudonocardia sp. C8]|uniref:methyltransferase family protein n=1 Tax=Pseudonocardia sp. C8 TaxID=2762759 RepID=UPI0016433C25|nr:isoprenylcysteine carboxylmethyltransferase family protein [Pseudonocardia sp. C8]MBC3192215.1 isoprenylcysteine carboxylmethyltransferase family protein [Pseudonocardia sp. C8]
MRAESASDRRRRRAALGSAAFLVAGPGTVAGVVPWLLTRSAPRRPFPGGAVTRAAGALLIGAGGVTLTTAFAEFVRDGLGTPVPAAPPTELVVDGLYRHVRNPMYVALAALVLGQALLGGRRRLLGYLAVMAVPVSVFVIYREEPVLRERFGEQYERYCAAVPRWLPRVRPWHGTA